MASYLSVLIQAAEPANYKLNYDEHYIISVPFATTTTPGIASFNGDYFKVVNGVVSLSDEYAGELGNIIDRLDDIDDRLDGIDDDITDLDNGKVDKVTPTEVGLYAYVVQKNSSNGVNNYILDIAPYNVVVPGAIVRYSLTGTLKTGSAETPLDAVNLLDLENATTNIPESALSSDVRVKLNKMISRVGISPADWEALPVADRDINTWYFVGPYGTAPNQYFVEYVYFVKNDIGVWEPLGSTLAVDLSGYFTKSEINALLAGKANTDGVYSGMSVGHANIADQINTDREIEDADTACPPTVFGTVGGNAEVQSGLMPFTELRGNTIKWNQLVQNGNFGNTDNWSASSGSLSVSSNVGTFTATAANGGISQDVAIKASHKYLITAQIKLTTATTSVYLDLRHGGGLSNVATQSTTDWQTVSGIISASDSNYAGYIRVRDGRASDWDAIQIKNFMLFDLTAIYGAGNEPSTYAEIVRDFPMPYYAYNAGTLLSSKSSSVDFVKRNQWDEETEAGSLDENGEPSYSVNTIRSKNFCECFGNTVYFLTRNNHDSRLYWYDANKNFISRNAWGTNDQTYTTPANARYFKIIIAETNYNHDICIYINWETPGLPYVPYSKQHITLPNIELRSAGSAYDVLYQQGGGKRRIGEVDLSELEWHSLTVSGHLIFYANNTSQKTYTTNIVCDKYESGNFDISIMPNKSITGDGGAGTSLWIRDDSYATLEAFKAAISGTVYFELATETDITLEENPGWTEYAEIDNFGTVKFNQDPAQNIPVPQAYFVRYTVNLVEFLDSLFVHCGGDVSKIALTS